MNQSPMPAADTFKLSLPAIVLVNTPTDTHNLDCLTLRLSCSRRAKRGGYCKQHACARQLEVRVRLKREQTPILPRVVISQRRSKRPPHSKPRCHPTSRNTSRNLSELSSWHIPVIC